MYFKKIALSIALASCSLSIANGKLNEYDQRSNLQSIITQHPLVIIDFWASWCGPCKRMTPELAKIAKKHPEVYIVKVNTDSYKSISQSYGISSIPTLFFYKDGKKISTQAGSKTFKQLDTLITQYFGLK